MARHVSWRAGGTADRFFAPAMSKPFLFLQQVPARASLFVGLGSLLCATAGSVERPFPFIGEASPEMREAGCTRLAASRRQGGRFAALQQLAGRGLAGIPGTSRRARMNAGCYGGETWESSSASIRSIARDGYFAGKKRVRIRLRHCLQNSGRKWFVALISSSLRATVKSRSRIKEFLAKRSPPSRCKPTREAFSAPARRPCRRLI